MRRIVVFLSFLLIVQLSFGQVRHKSHQARHYNRSRYNSGIRYAGSVELLSCGLMKNKHVDGSHLLLGISTTHGINYNGLGVGVGVGFKYTQRALLQELNYLWDYDYRYDFRRQYENTSIRYEKNSYLLPIYVRVGYGWNLSSVVPTIMMDVGYTYNAARLCQSLLDRDYYIEGPFVEPSVGVKYKIREDVSISLLVGVYYQRYHYGYREEGSILYTKSQMSYNDYQKKNTSFLSYNVKLGLDF